MLQRSGPISSIVEPACLQPLRRVIVGRRCTQLGMTDTPAKMLINPWQGFGGQQHRLSTKAKQGCDPGGGTPLLGGHPFDIMQLCIQNRVTERCSLKSGWSRLGRSNSGGKLGDLDEDILSLAI